MACASCTIPVANAPPLASYNVEAGWQDRILAVKKWQSPYGKVVPVALGPTRKAFVYVFYKGESHKDWLQHAKMVAEYFSLAAPRGDTPLLNMMIRVNKKPDLQTTTSAGGAWAAATMAALANLKPSFEPDMQPPIAEEWLDAALEGGLPKRGWDCHGVLPRQVTTLPQLTRTYYIMPRNHHGSSTIFRGLLSLQSQA